MRDQGHEGDALDLELYAHSQSRLRSFKELLPTHSVEDLAREVLRRLSERAAEFSLEYPSDVQIDRLCKALVSSDERAGAKIIQQVRTDGASVEAVYLKYLAAAARMLGQWWEDDLVSFTEVTLGTSRMYSIMRAIRHQLPIVDSLTDRSAIFVSVPGETHTLGIQMAADLFRKDGWTIDLLIGETHDALVSGIAESDTTIVGISAGGEHALNALSKLIIALRIKKPRAAVIVSGRIINEAREAVELIGIDGMVGDIDSAKILMTSLWDRAHAKAR